ncbi:hypothetical protein INR49_029475 [Caranx melampygus]|nr:hypothetical protein INR49_029475 [Caranx melampygus]
MLTKRNQTQSTVLSSVLLLAPLLAEADPAPHCVSRTTPRSAGADGLCSHFRWMAEHVPAFRVPGTSIHILTSPDQFYQAMKARIKTAKRRVVMASLYLGTGQLEQELHQRENYRKGQR